MRGRRWAGIVMVWCAGVVTCAPAPVVDAATPGLVGTASARTDTVYISAAKQWGPGHVARISRVATSLDTRMYRIAYPTFSMSRLTRVVGDVETDVQDIPNKWFIPMGATVFPVEMVRQLAGDEPAEILARGEVLMDERSAKMRGAAVGDVMYLRSATRRDVPFVIGGFVRKWLSESSDIMMSDATARGLGLSEITRLAFVGGRRLDTALTKLRSAGFVNGNAFRIRASWFARNPDENMGIVTMKLALGEFYYRPQPNRAVDIQYGWRLRNIAWNKSYTGVPLQMSCHVKIVDAIQGALTEIKRAGLASEINVADTNRYGGCYASRMSRLGNSFASLSRHSWAAALDINVTTNGQGVIPRMNCDVVRIFRKWGFAWGGNFTPFDGMHFEWVGEPRHKLDYPSMRCANRVDGPVTTTTTIPATTTTTEPPTSTTTTVPGSSTTVAQ